MSIRFVCSFAVCLLTAATSAGAGERLRVYVVNAPLAYFAERIGGDAVDVVFPAPMGEDPAFWRPEPAIIAGFQGADLVLLNGAGYARWLDKVTLRESRVVDTSKAFADRFIALEGAVTHSHGPEGPHSHTGTASTTWLDLRLAAEQSRAVADALVRLAPERATAIRGRQQELEAELLALDRRLEESVAPRRDLPLLASHPVYAYLARRYGLSLRSVVWEPDEAPGPADWREFEMLLTGHPGETMLWEAEPRADTASRLRALGVASLVFDPGGSRQPEADFMDRMERNVENLRRAFAAPPSEAATSPTTDRE